MHKTINFTHLIEVRFNKGRVELYGERIKDSGKFITIRMTLPILFAAISFVRGYLTMAKKIADKHMKDYQSAVS